MSDFMCEAEQGRCCDDPECDGCWPDHIDTNDESEWCE